MNHHTNIVRIKAVSDALKDLSSEVVFVGGATISLYADRPILDVRYTDDVDVIVEILNYNGRVQLEEKLIKRGFSNDIESQIICRYKIKGIVVDIMPTNDPSIGFTNKWYADGYKNAVNYTINHTCIVKILSAPYFIATKLEAHKGRGKNDGRTSHDFEDIVFVLENRRSIWDEMSNTPESLKGYLMDEFKNLLQNTSINEWIDCHVERGQTPATDNIIKNIKQFVGL